MAILIGLLSILMSLALIGWLWNTGTRMQAEDEEVEQS